MAERLELIGDVGGTNARFAIAEASAMGFHSAETFPCEAFETPEAAIESFLKSKSLPDPDAICLAAAGPVRQGAAEFTNNPWKLCETNLKARFGAPLVRVSNDFEAIAHALPHLRTQDIQVLGPRAPAAPGDEPFCYAVVGPGTGLGAAALLGQRDRAQVAVSEAGHVGFAPESPLQDSILSALRQRFGRVSAERLVSGPGLENLYSSLCELQGLAPETRSAASIVASAQDPADPLAMETVTLFQRLLGQFAGDFALAVGARQGLFLAGGVAQKLGAALGTGPFREGFEAKGRHRGLLSSIPTALITHPQPGLLGAAALLRDLDPRQAHG